MKTSKSRIEEIKAHGYDLDFSMTFNLAFDAYKKMALMAGVVMLLIMIIVFGIVITASVMLVGAGDLSESMVNFDFKNLSAVFIVLYVAALATFAGIMNPMVAGLIQMAHNAHMDQDVAIGTAFSYYKGRHFGELFIAGFVLALFGGGISTASDLLLFPLIGSLISVLISVFTIMTIPLIIFADLKALDAISNSFALVAKNFWIILGLLIIAVICAMVGFIALCIGILFTIPFVYAMYYSIYVNAVGLEENTEFDEIGSGIE